MRSSMYDYDGWSRDTGMVPQHWEPGQPVEPYGEVPGGQPPAPENVPGPRRTPQLWGGRKKQSSPRPKKERPREENGTGGFCLLLALLLILTGVAVYFQGGIQAGESMMEQFWDWDEFEGWGKYYYYEYGDDDSDWVEDLEGTSIERAPLREDVTLALTPAGESELTAREIYDRVSPSVVGIRAMVEDGMYLGTGVVMTGDGYIITNAHVIAGAQSSSVIFSNNSRAKALLVGYDGETDLAVLKVDREDLVPAEFGDSSQLRVGDPAYAIGNPLGEELRGTMTSGIISAIDRTVDMDGQSMTLIQTNAALNSGNSGGALINSAGQVVGITNMKMMSEWETIEGLGFAVPTAQAKVVVDQIISLGYYTGRPALGITVADHYDDDGSPDGVEVISVKKGSGAEGRLYAGDIIVSAQELSVSCTDDLLRIKDWLIVGEEIHLQVRTEAEELVEVSLPLSRSSEMTEKKDSTARRGNTDR